MCRYKWIQNIYLFFFTSFAATVSNTTEKWPWLARRTLSINSEQMKREGISQSFILSLKCAHPIFIWISHLIFNTTVNLNEGHKFSQFIYRFKIWIFKCWSWAVYTTWKRWKIGIFEWPRLHFIIFPNSLKSLKIGTFEVSLSPYFFLVRIIFQYDMWHKRGGTSLGLNCQFSRKIVIL